MCGLGRPGWPTAAMGGNGGSAGVGNARSTPEGMAVMGVPTRTGFQPKPMEAWWKGDRGGYRRKRPKPDLHARGPEGAHVAKAQ